MITRKIKDQSEATEYIVYLYNQGLLYHLDEDAYNIEFNQEVSSETKSLMNDRNNEIDTIANFDKHLIYLELVDPSGL